MQSLQQSYEKITTQVQDLVPKLKLMAQNQNRVIGLVGTTGSGKSTLTCYLLNALLKYEKAKKGKYLINHSDPSSKQLPVIGHQSQSCTSVPSIFEIDAESYVDLTGWFDTGTSTQQIINAFSNSSIFKKGKQVKILIVVDIASLTTLRGGILVEIVQRLAEFFQGDLTILMSSMVLVVSKVNTDEWDVQSAEQQILSISKKNQNFTQITKTLIEHLVRNHKIVLFPTPDKITDHINKIKGQLKKTKTTVLTHDGKATLSHSATNDVSKYISVLNSQITKSSKQISSEISQKFNIANYKDGNQVNEDLCKLRKAEGILKTQFGKFTSIRDQKRILEDLKSNLNLSGSISQDLNKNLTMVAFYKQINSRINLDSTFMENLSLQISENIGKLQAKRIELTSQEERKVMEQKHLQDIRQRQKANEEILRQNQKRYENYRKQTDEKILQQQIVFQEQMRKCSQKYANDLQAMNKQLIELANRPAPEIHVDGGGGCEIM